MKIHESETELTVYENKRTDKIIFLLGDSIHCL